MYREEHRLGLPNKFDFSKCMKSVDMNWRVCRDTSGAFITVMTFSFIVVGILWAILARFKKEDRAERNVAEGKPASYSGTKIQRDMVTRTGTIIDRSGNEAPTPTAE